MIRIRPFLNSDAPALAEIWRSQPPQRALLQPMTPALLELHVFSKPYFRREHILLACEGDTDARRDAPVGFVHVALGASDDRSDTGRDTGVVAMLMVVPQPDASRRREIGAELLAAAESLLVSCGAKRILGIGVAPNDPFYHGLYGGGLMAGAMESSSSLVGWFRDAGFAEQRKIEILHCPLLSFRPVVNRQQMQARRQFQIQDRIDPPLDNWWDACTLGHQNRTRFWLTSTTGRSPAFVDLSDVEPLASSWGVHATGVLRIEVDAAMRRQGLATYLLGETLRTMQGRGTTVAEAHVPEDDVAALGLFRRLGFERVDRGLVFVKQAAS